MRVSIKLPGVLSAALLAATAALAAPVTSPATVRSGPSPKWPVIGQVTAGTDVEVLNCGAGWKADWCQIRYDDKTGFVAANTLAPSGANDVQVAPVVTTDQANIHKGPGPRYRMIGVVPAGATVNMGECVNGWARGWCRINYDGQVGYVLGSLLQRQGALFP